MSNTPMIGSEIEVMLDIIVKNAFSLELEELEAFILHYYDLKKFTE